MAAGSWVKLTGLSFGVAALLAGAELGAANSLGILAIDRIDAAGTDPWRDLRSWITFLFAVAVLGGAAASLRTVRAAGSRNLATLVVARLVCSICAGLGAAVAFPLVWLPVRALESTAAHAAELTLATTAGAGIGVGVVISVAALAATPVGVSAAATAVWVWTFALASIGLLVARGQPLVPPRLGMVDAPGVIPPDAWWFGPYVMVGLAGAFGLAIAAGGRLLGSHRLGIAVSGLAGPLLVAWAYLVSGPGTGTRLELYIAALMAATVGLLASTAVAATQGRTKPPSIPASSVPAIPQPAELPAASASEPVALEAAPAPLAIEAAPPRAQRQRRSSRSPRESRPPRELPAAPSIPARLLLDPEEERSLGKGDREHIEWMQTLLNTPADPELNRRR